MSGQIQRKSRQRFVREFRKNNGVIDAQNLSRPLKNKLSKLGVSEAHLKRIAGSDGKISGHEFDKLFKFVDGFDGNRNRRSLVVARKDGQGNMARTKSGALYDELKQELDVGKGVGSVRSAHRALAGRRRRGVIDLNTMSPALAKKMAAAGIKKAHLEKLAGPDGQIRGSELKSLLKLVDRADGKIDGKIETKAMAPDRTVKDSTAGEIFRGLRAEVRKNHGLAQYAPPGLRPAPAQRPLRAASDALVVPSRIRKSTVQLPMRGIGQFAKKPNGRNRYHHPASACFKAARDQTNEFNAEKFGRKSPRLNGPGKALQMAYAEDREASRGGLPPGEEGSRLY